MNLLFDESGFSQCIATDCGPFHPDYAIMWESDEVENYLMICYTCGSQALQRILPRLRSMLIRWILANLLANFKANRHGKN